MRSPTDSDPSELEALRARTLAELEHQREHDRIDADEYERRSERASEAATALDLRPLVADLLASSPQGLSDPPARVDERSFADARPSETGVVAGGEGDRDWAIAVMSGSNRSGQWEPAEHVTALSIMGGIRLDFREAAFLEGVVTKVSAFAVMAGIEIIVPPDIHVSVAGTGLLGGFGHVSQTAAHPDAPRLHISGLAIMGGVDVKVRDIGEIGGEDDSP